MSRAYPHVRLPSTGPVFLAHCRCGAGLCMPQMSEHPPYTPAPESWGSDCSSALRERIGELETERDAAHTAGRLAERADMVAHADGLRALHLSAVRDDPENGAANALAANVLRELVRVVETRLHVGAAVKP